MAGAMNLAVKSGNENVPVDKNRISGRKSFKSKLIGSFGSAENGDVTDSGKWQASASRAKSLVKKII